MNPNTSGPTEAELIAGKTHVEVVHTKDRKKEVVAVYLLSVREIDRYAQIVGENAAVAELFTRQKPRWADGLTNESVYAVVAEGERLNADPFAAHLRYIAERSARMEPITKGALKPSPAGSPESAAGSE